MEKSLFIFCDGGSRGNPGPAASGFIVKDAQGKVLVQRGKYIGKTTNNVAEYMAVIEALEWIKKYRRGGGKWEASRPTSHLSPSPSIQFFLDSKLVVNQLNGLFKIKNAYLRSLVIKVRQLEREMNNSIFYRFIPREKNRAADALVNQILKKI